MSRIKTFIDFSNQQVNDVVSILDDVGESVSVYESQRFDGNPGFDAEMPEPTFLKNILAYIQPERGSAVEKKSDVGSGTQLRYIGITMDTDVRMGQIWKSRGKEYHVVRIDDSASGKTEVGLVRNV